MNREDFPMLKQDVIYFDNSATSLKPNSVINKTSEYYKDFSVSIHRGDYDLSYKVNIMYEEVRLLVANFINAKDKSEIIFTNGTTESLNMIANGFVKNHLLKDDEILITVSEHASNVLPWFRLERKMGVKVKFIPLDDDYHVTVDNFKKMITPRTKCVALAHITNVIGDLRPIKEICKIAKENNIITVIDGAQSASHLKVDVQDIDCDFYAFSAHKCYGPTGVGVLYGKEELLDKLEAINLGGGMNESFDSPTDIYLKSLPLRLEAGTPNIAGVIGFGEAIKYINNIGMDKITSYERDLRNYLYSKLKDISHIDILNKKSESSILTFNVKDIFPQDVAFYLNKYNICIRAGNHCAKLLKEATNVSNTLRISLSFYNTKEEIDLLVDLLKDKNKIRNEML
ncbi:MAG: cysteine desulfurase [Mollicutes bacterium]|nr:cysteine desulfurase [Mollicutes bacterium]